VKRGRPVAPLWTLLIPGGLYYATAEAYAETAGGDIAGTAAAARDLCHGWTSQLARERKWADADTVLDSGDRASKVSVFTVGDAREATEVFDDWAAFLATLPETTHPGARDLAAGIRDRRSAATIAAGYEASPVGGVAIAAAETAKDIRNPLSRRPGLIVGGGIALAVVLALAAAFRRT
jgi:hypothetical protein